MDDDLERRVRVRVATIGRRLESHAGGLALEGIDDDGTVTVRLTGLCTGCPYKALCTSGTVGPGLRDLDGVGAVRVHGARTSQEAADRLEALLDGRARWTPAPPSSSTQGDAFS